MATVRKPSSVAARKTRMAISLRLATSNLRWRDGTGVEELIDKTGQMKPDSRPAGNLGMVTASQRSASGAMEGYRAAPVVWRLTRTRVSGQGCAWSLKNCFPTAVDACLAQASSGTFGRYLSQVLAHNLLRRVVEGGKRGTGRLRHSRQTCAPGRDCGKLTNNGSSEVIVPGTSPALLHSILPLTSLRTSLRSGGLPHR